MKKLSFLLFVSVFAAGIFVGCSSGTEVKVATDSSKMKTAILKPASDTISKDSVKGKPIVPPPNN